MQNEHPGYDPTELVAVDTGRSKANEFRFKCSCGREFETMRGLRSHQGQLRSDDWDKPETKRYRAHLTVTASRSSAR
jgi:hypothetical protein